MRLKTLAVAALATAALAACSSWHGTGTVVQKSYEAASTWTTYESVCYSHNSSGACTFSMQQPHEHYEPEQWKLKVRDSEGKNHTVEVSETEYNQAVVGYQFTNGEGS